jgi:multisubunit Na+/H+ antiporter MnhC subunit
MARTRPKTVNVTLVSVFFAAAALVAVGAFVATWKRDLTHALAGLPLMFGGAGAAFVGVSRFAAAAQPQVLGQEAAVLLSVAALSLVALGVGLAGREGSR